jgi:hypothetical protein
MDHDQIHHQRGKAQSNGPGKAFLWRTHISTVSLPTVHRAVIRVG